VHTVQCTVCRRDLISTVDRSSVPQKISSADRQHRVNNVNTGFKTGSRCGFYINDCGFQNLVPAVVYAHTCIRVCNSRSTAVAADVVPAVVYAYIYVYVYVYVTVDLLQCQPCQA